MSITAGPERGSLPSSALTVLDTRLLDDWGQRLAATVHRGGRLLIAASGGSAAQAEQLAAQLNGWAGTSRTARPAIVLHPEASAGTGPIPVATAPAVAVTPAAATATASAPGSRGYADELARQVREHGRPGDVLLAMSVSGRGRNLVRAIAAARAGGIAAWCLTGPAPNPLADACDDVVCVYPAGARALALSATVREAHQVALHLICLSFDAAMPTAGETGSQHAATQHAATQHAATQHAATQRTMSHNTVSQHAVPLNTVPLNTVPHNTVRAAPPEAAPPSPLIARG